MKLVFSRRTFVQLAPLAGAGFVLARTGAAIAGESSVGSAAAPSNFPQQDHEVAQQVVGLSHGKLEELTPLVEARPSLANAAYDWGFGDWETAMGAASHVGRLDIAEFLIRHGARPDLFTFAMMGHLALVRSAVETVPGIQSVRGPHGITLLQHARNAGERSTAVVEYLERVGGADPTYDDAALGAEEKAALVGSYTFQGDPSRSFLVEEKMGGITMKVAPGAARRLFHRGGWVFHPAGAPHVEVRFSSADSETKAANRAAQLRVKDSTLEVTATR